MKYVWRSISGDPSLQTEIQALVSKTVKPMSYVTPNGIPRLSRIVTALYPVLLSFKWLAVGKEYSCCTMQPPKTWGTQDGRYVCLVRCEGMNLVQSGICLPNARYSTTCRHHYHEDICIPMTTSNIMTFESVQAISHACVSRCQLPGQSMDQRSHMRIWTPVGAQVGPVWWENSVEYSAYSMPAALTICSTLK